MFVMRLISLGIKILNHEIVGNLENLMCRGNQCPESEVRLDLGAIQLTDRSQG